MIEYRNITLSFQNQNLFQQFNLTINENEKILLDAPSGNGKTTLVKMLLGLIKYQGEIYFNGNKLTHHTKNEFRKQISYVSQDVDLPNDITRVLFKKILLYKVNKHIKYNEDVLVNYLHKFNLKVEILDKKVNELSGGERARIGLIIALLLDRPVLLLDEVTAGLDEAIKIKIIDFILNLKKTIITISHDRLWKQKENIEIVGWGHE